MSIENQAPIVMTETHLGTYVGTYPAPVASQGRYAYLTVRLQTPDGQDQAVSDADVIYVRRATASPFPLTIVGPYGGSHVAQSFDLSGMTLPGAIVSARLWAPNSTGLWQEAIFS